ncbi:MAG: hypothetical protein AAGB28_07820 [Pseudomonadota bacterium]
MKTFLTALVMATTLFAAQAHAFGPTTNSLTRDLTFPVSSPEIVTQDKIKTSR